jgi:hypothetical protein
MHAQLRMKAFHEVLVFPVLTVRVGSTAQNAFTVVG